MKNIILDFCKRNILVLIMIIVLCPVLAVSYSSLVMSSNNYRASEMYIGKLLYSLEINDTNSNIISIPANSEMEISLNITSLNSVSSKYVVVYNSTLPINAKYSSDYTEPAYGLITNTKTITIYIKNQNSSAVTITFNIAGGYTINEVSDIVIPSGYVALDSSYLKYDVNFLALFVNDVRVDALSDDVFYELESYTCTNNETVTWDYSTKKISIEPFSSATRCTLNFIPTRYLIYEYLSTSYYCSNGSAGSAPYELHYTGDCTIENDGGSDFKIKFTSSGTLTLNKLLDADLFLVGGGAGGDSKWTGYDGTNFFDIYGAGGGSGYTQSYFDVSLDPGTYPIVVGSGGAGGYMDSTHHEPTNGNASSFNTTYLVDGGNGKNGGSGGGGYGSYAGGIGGNGGIDGEDGNNGKNGIGNTAGTGGIGQGTTTREFGLSTGILYASGGSGGAAHTETLATPNSGNGGNGSSTGEGSDGLDGIVIIRNTR